jgi:hypothetical protein
LNACLPYSSWEALAGLDAQHSTAVVAEAADATRAAPDDIAGANRLFVAAAARHPKRADAPTATSVLPAGAQAAAPAAPVPMAHVAAPQAPQQQQMQQQAQQQIQQQAPQQLQQQPAYGQYQPQQEQPFGLQALVGQQQAGLFQPQDPRSAPVQAQNQGGLPPHMLPPPSQPQHQQPQILMPMADNRYLSQALAN